MAQRRRIGLCAVQNLLQQGQVLTERGILNVSEILPEKGGITEQDRQQHIVYTKRHLAGADGLLPSAEEERDIRRAGADIQNHEAPARILGRA